MQLCIARILQKQQLQFLDIIGSDFLCRRGKEILEAFHQKWKLGKMDKVGLKGKVIILGVLPFYILHNDPLLSLQVERLKITNLVAPETNPD